MAAALGYPDLSINDGDEAKLTNMPGSGNPKRAAMSYIRPEIADNRAVFPDAAKL
jgi:hypothetical protein